MASQKLGRYAALRPVKGMEQSESTEFMRDMLERGDMQDKLKEKGKPGSKGGATKKKKARRDSSTSSSSSSGSSSSSSDRSRRRNRKRQKKRSKSPKKKTGKENGRKRSKSSDGSYSSASNVEDDSDLEKGGLNLKKEINPLVFYMKQDRDLLCEELFKVIRGKRRKNLMPKVLRPIKELDLIKLCTEELSGWSNKRCRSVMLTGNDLLTEESSDDNDNTSDDESLDQMRTKMLAKQHEKFREEMGKLKKKQKMELEDQEAEAAELEKELYKTAEDMTKEHQIQLAELTNQLVAAERKRAEEEGVILVGVRPEKIAAEKKRKEDEEDKARKAIPNLDQEEDVASSLAMDEESSAELSINKDVDKIPMADSPGRQQQQGKPKKKKGKAQTEEQKPLENLVPQVPYNASKKAKKLMVKTWLANIGKDGPPLPVPDENYYPDYADPNQEDALREIEELQEAYEMDRRRKGRTDGKHIQKETGELGFDGSDDDRPGSGSRTPKDGASRTVAQRMLQNMLSRKNPSDIPVQPDYSRKDDTKYTDQKRYTVQAPAEGLVYERADPDGKGTMKFSKDVKKEEVGLGDAMLTKVKPENVEKLKLLDPATKNPKDVQKEKMAMLEMEMRARAIKAMMTKMQKKKNERAVDAKATAKTQEGEFPWQDDAWDDDV